MCTNQIGLVPASVEAILDYDLVGSVKKGDAVRIVGMCKVFQFGISNFDASVRNLALGKKVFYDLVGSVKNGDASWACAR